MILLALHKTKNLCKNEIIIVEFVYCAVVLKLINLPVVLSLLGVLIQILIYGKRRFDVLACQIFNGLITFAFVFLTIGDSLLQLFMPGSLFFLI